MSRASALEKMRAARRMLAEAERELEDAEREVPAAESGMLPASTMTKEEAQARARRALRKAGIAV